MAVAFYFILILLLPDLLNIFLSYNTLRIYTMLKHLWARTYQPTGCFRFFDRVSEPNDLLPTGGAHRYYNG